MAETDTPQSTKVTHSITYSAARFSAAALLLAARYVGTPAGSNAKERAKYAVEGADLLIYALGFKPPEDKPAE